MQGGLDRVCSRRSVAGRRALGLGRSLAVISKARLCSWQQAGKALVMVAGLSKALLASMAERFQLHSAASSSHGLSNLDINKLTHDASPRPPHRILVGYALIS